MNCTKCGIEAPEGAKFCASCGRRLPRPKPEPVAVAGQAVIRQVDPVLKPNAAAALLGISRWKLDELRIQGKLPENCYFIIPGGERKKIIRYKTRELLAWMDTADGSITTAG